MISQNRPSQSIPVNGIRDKPDHGNKDHAGPHSSDKTVTRDPKSDLAEITGTVGASKARARDAAQELISTLHEAQTVADCKGWILMNKQGLNALPADWIPHLEEKYEEHLKLCSGKVAA